MQEGQRLDEICAFGDKLRFLIPHEWVEEDEDDGDPMFHPPDKPGWFRASLITVSNVQEPTAKLHESFDDAQNVRIDEESGNWISSWVKDTIQDGDPIRLFYWKVANQVPPNTVRVAIFSYTVLAGQLGDPETAETVELLEALVSQARICAGDSQQ